LSKEKQKPISRDIEKGGDCEEGRLNYNQGGDKALAGS